MKKLKSKAQYWANILAKCPGVATISLSGSLSQDKKNANSDIDFFIIAYPQQIFTARFFVSGILKLYGQLAYDERNHAGKICPNHFITTQQLEIQEQDAYAAKLFTHNQFLAGDKKVWKSFCRKNKNWVKTFGYHFDEVKTPLPEKYLSTNKVGFWKQKIESICKRIQLNRIQKKASLLPKEAKVWLTDTEIRLHPNPKNLEEA